MKNSRHANRSAKNIGTPVGETGKLAFGFLLLFTFVAFGRPEDIFPVVGYLHLTLISAIGAALFCVKDLASGRAHFVWSPELILVFLLSAWFLIGMPFGVYRRGSIDLLMDVWLRTLTFFFVMTQTLTNIARVRNIIWAVLLSELLACGVSILIQGKQGVEVGDRLSGVNQGLLGWNFLGITVSATLPYIASLYVSRRSAIHTGLLLAVVGTSLWLVILTASRGAVLGILFSLVLTCLYILRRSRRGRIVALLLPLCLIIGLARAPTVFWSRFQTIWGGSNAMSDEEAASAEESTKGRELLLKQSIKYTLRFPIFGVGVGNFPVYNGAQVRQSDAWFGTHNTFTQISSEAGIPALALFISLFVVGFRRMKALTSGLAKGPDNLELRRLARATMIALASFAFNGFFAHLGYQFLIYYIVGIGAGLWAIAHQRSAATKQTVGAHKIYFEPAQAKWSTK